jgi:hypothetical protein
MRCFLMTVNLENNVISVFVVSIFFWWGVGGDGGK